MAGPVAPRRQPGKLHVPQLVVLCIVNFNEALQGNIIWPFIPMAVQRWGASLNDTGWYVGVLASSFFLAQLLCVTAWGRLADRYGRRPTLLVGLLGTAATMTLFGVARSFPVALAARFLTGALNGNVAIAKTYMGEMTDKTTISRGFAFLSFCWGFGTIVAPSLGGFLSDPADKYAAFADVTLFKTYPYLLPSLCSVAFSVVAFVVGFFRLPETEVFVQRAAAAAAAAAPATPGVELVAVVHADAHAAADDEAAGPAEVADVETAGLVPPPAPPALPLRVDDDDGTAAGDAAGGAPCGTPASTSRVPGYLRRHAGGGRRSDGAAAVRRRGSADGAGGDDVAIGTTAADGDAATAAATAAADGAAAAAGADDDASLGTASKPQRLDGDAAAGGDGDEEGAALLPAPTAGAAAAHHSAAAAAAASVDDLETPTRVSQLFRNEGLVAAVVAYGMLSFAAIIFDELLPVFMEMPVEEGGLGLETSAVGTVQVVAGATQVAFQLVVFPVLNQRYGPLLCFRNAMLPMAGLLVFPAVAHVRDPAVMWTLLAAAIAFKSGLSTVAFTSIMIAINNASRGVALGLVNGFAQSTASAVRTVGPTIGGAIFSASLHWTALGGLRLHVAYLVSGVACLCAFLFTFRMPSWINHPPDYSTLGRNARAAS